MKLSDVTIIIPVFCTDAKSLVWLEECLDSAMSQGTKVTVCDDGSTIDTIKTISWHLKEHHDYMMMPHRGVSAARNTAIDMARTQLIFPLDCDDKLKPDAIKQLLEVYDGTPLYPDITKFGDVDEPHYALLDFNCEYIYKYVGFSSVNVLHSKEQWHTVGMYDNTLAFYEDGEYNARLFLKYCGQRFPKPLVDYRIHQGQRTDTYRKRSGEFAARVKKMIGGYEMACASCGGKRRTGNLTATSAVLTNVNVDEMPLTDAAGNVLAQYLGGKGRGKHYYQGIKTNTMYKVLYGMYLYANVADTKTADQLSTSLLLKIERAPVAAMAQPVAKPSVKETFQKTEEVPVTVKQPISVKEPEAVDIEIASLSVKEILNSDDITADNAAVLLEREKSNLNRIKVIRYLEGLLS